MVIGDQEATDRIQAKLRHRRGINAEVVAALDPSEGWHRWGGQLSEADLEALVRDMDIHRVVVAPSEADAGDMLDVVRTLKALGVRVSVLPRIFEVVESSVVFDDLHGMIVLGVRNFRLSRSSALVKRGFDLLGSALMVVATMPLLILIAVAIKLGSRGPVFFRQNRIGRNGQAFEMLKFRTMHSDADARRDEVRHLNEAGSGFFKIAQDPRVTRVGRALRRTSLDELPQLFNVLRGEMSLVGPRPLIAEEDDQVEGFHRRRLELTPGITGHWQILGSSRVPLHEMVAIDYLYVANWSLWSDLKILLRTVNHVVGGRGM
jgi:exopolysaccharide biosynthesis polyprenyl glycosylphosphotransferase